MLNGKIPINFMRHYYDVYQLLQLERVQKFIGTKEYFEHKENRFRSGDEKDLTKNEALILSDANTRKLYQESFERTKNLYYKGQPDFDTVVNKIKSWIGIL